MSSWVKNQNWTKEIDPILENHDISYLKTLISGLSYKIEDMEKLNPLYYMQNGANSLNQGAIISQMDY